MYKKATSLLDKVLTTNAIGFSDEFKNNDLMGAYYNTNSRYRIERMRKYDRSLGDIPEVAAVLEIKNEDDDRRYSRSQTEMWESCYNALEKCFERFANSEIVKPAP